MELPRLSTLRTTLQPSKLRSSTRLVTSAQKLESSPTVFSTRATKRAKQVCLIYLLLAKSSIFQALACLPRSEEVLVTQMATTNLEIKVVSRGVVKILKTGSLALIQILMDSKRPSLLTK